jgi:hypothetical protein
MAKMAVANSLNKSLDGKKILYNIDPAKKFECLPSSTVSLRLIFFFYSYSVFLNDFLETYNARCLYCYPRLLMLIKLNTFIN